MCWDGVAIGEDVVAGGECSSVFFDIEALDWEGVQEGADGDGEGCTFLFGGGVN